MGVWSKEDLRFVGDSWREEGSEPGKAALLSNFPVDKL